MYEQVRWQETCVINDMCARKKRVSTPKAQIWEMIHNYYEAKLNLSPGNDFPNIFCNDKHSMQTPGLYFFMFWLGFNGFFYIFLRLFLTSKQI